jgi:hypothetical protein
VPPASAACKDLNFLKFEWDKLAGDPDEGRLEIDDKGAVQHGRLATSPHIMRLLMSHYRNGLYQEPPAFHISSKAFWTCGGRQIITQFQSSP